jgi:cell division transport system ATP-binding protein
MIELVGVRVEHPRGGAPLLAAADLRVARGEVVLVVGASGAGASRLCGALIGDHPVATGRVELMGRDLRRLRRASLLRLRRRLGIVPQDLRLLDDATVLGNVMLPLEIDHTPRRAAALRAAETLGRMGLAAELDVPAEALSMAERQRVALARALVREPAIVIADQPTSHQDPERALLIARVLDEQAGAGASVLVASRDPALWDAAGELGWRTLVLRDGRLLEVPVTAEQPVVETDVLDSAPLNVVPFPVAARAQGIG